jgi:hypothetical protein
VRSEEGRGKREEGRGRERKREEERGRERKRKPAWARTPPVA